MDAEFVEGELLVRRIKERDVPLLAAWLSNPQIAEWYGGRDRRSDSEWIREHYLLRTGRPQFGGIIEQTGHPVGYLQYGRVLATELAILGYSSDAIIYGVDLFLGDTAVWNHGLGSRIVWRTAQFLLERYRPERVIIDPQVINQRAIRAYEKASFVKRRIVSRGEFHEGRWVDCWLVEFE